MQILLNSLNSRLLKYNQPINALLANLNHYPIVAPKHWHSDCWYANPVVTSAAAHTPADENAAGSWLRYGQMQLLTKFGPTPIPKQLGWKAPKSCWMKLSTQVGIANSYNEQGAPAVHVAAAETVVVVIFAGNVTVLRTWLAVTERVETIVIVTVDVEIGGLDTEVDREVVAEIEALVEWLDEDTDPFVPVEDVFAVVVAVTMQEQALRIFEDEALQPELITDGVEIAIFVV